MGKRPEETRQPKPPSRTPIHLAGFTPGGQRLDNLGRTQPTRVNWLMLMHAIPGMIGEAFKVTVPDSYISLDVEEDGTEVVVVACPCGFTPRVPIARVAECECERFYLATGNRVLVANSPEQPTPVVD